MPCGVFFFPGIKRFEIWSYNPCRILLLVATTLQIDGINYELIMIMTWRRTVDGLASGAVISIIGPFVDAAIVNDCEEDRASEFGDTLTA